MRFDTHMIKQHLEDRGIDFDKTRVIMDKKKGVATFLLYNLSGKLVGYQIYNPKGSKKVSGGRHINKDLQKYYPYTTYGEIAVYGLDSYDKNHKYLFVVEGIFDAIKLHNQGLPAIAVLSNDPKNIKEWLGMLPQKIIVIYDNDSNKDSLKLKKYGDKSFTTPDPFKDLGDMSNMEVYDFIKSLKI